MIVELADEVWEVIDAFVAVKAGTYMPPLSIDCAVWVPGLADARPGRRTKIISR
jgi:hypothetical protein